MNWKIIEQKFKCTFCGVETTGRFEAEIDEERVKQNKKWEEEYKKESNEYLKKYNEHLNKRSEYQKIVDTHNECERKHRGLFSKAPQLWEISCRGWSYDYYIVIKGTNEYPELKEPAKPKKHFNNYTKYITCPVCSIRYYFK